MPLKTSSTLCRQLMSNKAELMYNLAKMKFIHSYSFLYLLDSETRDEISTIQAIPNVFRWKQKSSIYSTNLHTDMIKGVVPQSLTAEICMDCGNVCLQHWIFSPIHLLKLKYYGTFTYITQIVHSNTQFNTLKGVFRDKPL